MQLLLIVTILRVLVIAIAIVVFFLKYRRAQEYKSRYKKVDSRWLLWYDSMEILGTSSRSRRDFMLMNNRLSTTLWLSVLLGILLFVIPFKYLI